MNPFILLILLNICHYFADYSHLSTDWMLNAKRFGKPLLPIFAHASIHAFIMLTVMSVYWDITTVGYFPHAPYKILWLSLFQLATHFLIDVWKGRMNGWFPSLQSPANKGHWYIFGFDQFLHQVVIILMVYIITLA